LSKTDCLFSFLSFPVIVSEGSHPFPSRTRKLSPLEPMVLRGQLRGRVGSRRIKFTKRPFQKISETASLFLSQMNSSRRVQLSVKGGRKTRIQRFNCLEGLPACDKTNARAMIRAFVYSEVKIAMSSRKACLLFIVICLAAASASAQTARNKSASKKAEA